MKGIVCGDCVDILSMLPNNSVDCLATDPPYGLTPGGKKKSSGGFLGLGWDGTGIQYSVDLWRECLRILKPGAHAFVMAAPKNYHRVAWALEAAGFTINTPLIWYYTQGYPKALDIGRGLDKQAFVGWLDRIPHRLNKDERRKAISAAVGGAYARIQDGKAFMFRDDVPAWKTSKGEGVAILEKLVRDFWDEDGLPPGVRLKIGEKPWSKADDFFGGPDQDRSGRPQVAVTEASSLLAKEWEGWKSPQLKPAYEHIAWASKPLSERTYVANVKRWGAGGINVDKVRIPSDRMEEGFYPASALASEGCVLPNERIENINLDEWWRTQGIFDVPKPSLDERSEGLGTVSDDLPLWENFGVAPFSEEVDRGVEVEIHPTAKPIVLMSYIVSLGCLPGGLVLDPFMGAGTTLIAAEIGGWGYLGIELSERWCRVAAARVENWRRKAGRI